ncbi:MAG: RNA polymerase sigma factor [Chromatiales bacterium]|nr:MAG: RNA polymerase sigma factor [Chromatiales bacterium]
MSGFANKSVPRDVLDRAQRGDMRAHAEIFRAFSRPVYTLAARMTGSTAVADDILQETFLEVIRSLGQFRAEASLATWVRRIAVSKSLMHLRSAWQRRATLFRDLGEAEATAIEPATPGEARAVQLNMDLERALARLPDVSRVVVLLYDVEGYSHAEIARQMGMSVSFSKSQLSRAHARLREMLGEQRAGGSDERAG